MWVLLSAAIGKHHEPSHACREEDVNTRRWGVLVFAGLVLSPLLAARPARKIDGVTTVKMEADPDHKMVGVPCQINGARHLYVCVIDSGATNTIISDRVVKPEGPTVEMSTGNGVVRVHERDVSLKIGEGLELKSKALVQSKMLQGVDILVGQDVLRQFRCVIFDFDTRQVEFQR